MIPKYLAPEAGERVQLMGEPRILKLTPAESGGAYLQFETTHAPGSTVPPHWHRAEDEAFYVLAGQFTFLGLEGPALEGWGCIAPHARQVARFVLTFTHG
jgi:quercetin dioxygenase-like cupin family protein